VVTNCRRTVARLIPHDELENKLCNLWFTLVPLFLCTESSHSEYPPPQLLPTTHLHCRQMAATYAPSSSGTRVTLRVGNLPPYLTHEDFQRLWQSSDGWLGGRVLGSGHGVAEFSSLIAAQRAKSTYEGWTGFGAPLSLNVDAAPAAPQPSENFAYGGVAWSNVSYRSLARRQACHAAASSDPEMFGKLAQTRPGAVGDASAQAPVHQYGQSRASTQPQHSQAQGVYTPGSDPFPPPPRMLHGVSWNTCKQAGQAFPMHKYACEQWQNCTLVTVKTLSMQQLIALPPWRMDFTDTVRDAGAPRYIALRLAQAHNGPHVTPAAGAPAAGSGGSGSGGGNSGSGAGSAAPASGNSGSGGGGAAATVPGPGTGLAAALAGLSQSQLNSLAGLLGQ
ncbi:hypothetical protein QJQ45_028733, partial [Haematococcus lacustris]